MENIYNDLLKIYRFNNPLYQSKIKEIKSVLEKDNVIINNMNSKYIPYPELTDNNFNKKIYKKKEFSRYKSLIDYKDKTYENVANMKCNNNEFELSQNQKFVKNFLAPITPYNGLLLFHSVGLGKTCSAISIAEQYLSDDSNPKKVLVVLSPNIMDNFKKQIFDISKYDIKSGKSTLCTGTKYPDMIFDKDLLSDEILDKKIAKLIKERYQLVGYKQLAKIVEKVEENIFKYEKNPEKHVIRINEKLKELFSNRLIIVDEAHNLRMQSENSKKLISNALMKILQNTTNTKLLMLSATPMYDNAKEILWMINLLLINDKRPKIKLNDIFDAYGKITSKGEHIFRESIKGYVSYMRGENPFSFPLRLYPSINNDNNVIKVYPTSDTDGNKIKKSEQIKYLELIGSKISDLQEKYYNIIESSHINIINSSMKTDNSYIDDEKTSIDIQNKLQLCNIAYPNLNSDKAYYGEDGFKNCFDVDIKKRFKYNSKCLDNFGEILNYDNLEKYSPKIKKIIDYILNSKGIIFIYSQYYYSGIFPLALALEHIGFTKYNSSNLGQNLTVNKKVTNKSYIILSGDSDGVSQNNSKEINESKSPLNIDGDKIKVIIASKVAIEGIDFKNIREVHILEPWFNLNRIEQIIGRAVRTCSHTNLPIEKRNVTIYLHALEMNKKETIDIKTYRIAETKQKEITKIQRIMKETSIDCNLNKDTLLYLQNDLNIKINLETSQNKLIKDYKIGDKDNSYICDYDKCEIKCNPEINTIKTDDTTFDPLFVLDDINKYKNMISLYSIENKVFTYEKLKDYLLNKYKLIEDDILSYALEEMIGQKYKILDKNNKYNYIVYRGNLYILQLFNPIEDKLSMEERDNIKIKSKLELKYLFDKEENKNEKNNSVKEKIIVDSINYIPPDIYIYIDENIKNLENQIKNITKKSINKDLYFDFIFDRLSQEQLFLLIKENIKNPLNKYNKDIIRQDIFLNNEYFINPYDNQYYKYEDEKIIQCGPFDLDRIKDDIKKHQDKLKIDKNELKSFLSMKKNREIVFKLKNENNKGSGFVCVQTSSLKRDDLRNMINELEENTLSDNNNYLKTTLCELYELLLRSKKQVKKIYQNEK